MIKTDSKGHSDPADQGASAAPAQLASKALPVVHATGPTLTRVDGVCDVMSSHDYRSQLRLLQIELVKLQRQVIRKGDKVVMWYPSSNRDEETYEDPDRFDVTRNPDHQAFGGGGRHFCLGSALARLELRILIEETLKRFPATALDGTPAYAVSPFANQLKSLPVRLHG